MGAGGGTVQTIHLAGELGQVEGHRHQLTRTRALGSAGDTWSDNDPLRREPRGDGKAPESVKGGAKDGLEAHGVLLYSGTETV